MEFSLIRKIIAKQFNINPDTINENTLFEDLGADSLDLYELTLVIEETMNVKIDIKEYVSIKTVADILKYINKV